LNYQQTRIAVERVFTERGTHPLPRTFEIPPTWHLELATFAHTLEFPIKDVDQIGQRFQGVLDAIVIPS